MNKLREKNIYPVLPLRDVVVFPEMIFPLFVGRKKSVQALEKAMMGKKYICLIAQKDPTVDDISRDDIYGVGVLAKIVQLLKLPDGTLKVLVETLQRVDIVDLLADYDYFAVDVDFIHEIKGDATKVEAISRSITDKFKKYIKLENRIPTDLLNTIVDIEDPVKLADHIVSSLPIRISQKQKVLEIADIYKRLEVVYQFLKKEFQIVETEHKIKNRIKNQVEDSQREYYLNEQLKAIKKELGSSGKDSDDDDVKIFEKQIKKLKLTKEARNKANSELKKLKGMNPLSSEAGIVRGYLEWLLNIPWGKSVRKDIDLDRAEEILNRDHYGLEKIKERILEYIVVSRRVKKVKGPILCFVGPPGVGKTSLARSIAESVNRKFVKMSLGGMRDEAEIRGHRRTYVGALPGKVVQLMRKSKTTSPLFLLDEIDKLGSDFRGDPSSALLEVLDPEQNSNFNDHYLEVDYDLSDVMFITTANSLNIPPALLDRMEIIRLSGYTEDEKLQISKNYLVPKQLEYNGLKTGECSISDAALIKLIHCYTYEAGVRSLEREIANLARKAARKIDGRESKKRVNITVNNIEKFSGVPRYTHGKIEEKNLVGVVTGLAYTEFGGDILAIEAVKTHGEGKITYTGKLGDVMKESMEAAYQYFKANCESFGILPEEYKKYNIHIHVPEGATPKDGPSAGCAIFTTIVSILTEIPVDRYVAMTGEITLRGRALPIGGLKEKLLAALRAGIKKVIIPKRNEKDLTEIPDNVKEGLEIIFADNLHDVITHALIKLPVPAKKWLGKSKKVISNKDEVSTH